MKRNKIILTGMLIFIFVIPVSAAEIHDAASSGDLGKVKALLSTDPKLVNTKDSVGRTPLHRASRGVHLEVIKYLVQKGADINVLDKNGIAAMHSLAARGHGEAIAFLIQKGAKVNIGDSMNTTPLHYACIYGRKDAVVLLVKNGAGLEIIDDYKRTPLLLAARESGDLDIARFLVKKGANVNAIDKYGDTPLTLAAWRGFKELVNYLIDKGADIPVKDDKGKTLIFFAVSKGLDKLFERMVAGGMDLEGTDKTGRTLLHPACGGGSSKIVKALIEKGLSVSQKDMYGWSPLHFAAYKGRDAVVETLIKKGAAIDTRNFEGKTPFNIAKEEGNKEVIDQLIANGADRGPQKFPILEGKYLGQKRPGREPVLFAKGIAAGYFRLHSSVVFSPDGKEAMWTVSIPPKESGYSHGAIMTTKMKNNRWTPPVKIPNSSDDDVPFFSPDGQKLYFISVRPTTPGGKKEKENIWVKERKGDGWSEPRPLDPVVNARQTHWQFSVDKKGNIYFGSKGSIMYSKFIKGRYTEPEIVDTGLSGGGTPFISPDGSYLIFHGKEPNGPRGDLYICFRKKDGTWTRAKTMGETINSSGNDICPVVTPDGKYLFYLTVKSGTYGPHWVDAKIIEELRPKELK
jgi:ankyrin repeat protein